MYRDGLSATSIKRVEPFQGLLIDAAVWRDAHEYHRRAAALHALLLHGSGIVRGLMVTVDPAAADSRGLLISPGAALDPEGRLVTVAGPIRYRLNTEGPGTVYLLLTARDIPSDPILSADNGARRPSRLVEGYAVSEYDRLPDMPYLELARIHLGAGRTALATAANPHAPQADELDGRYRVEAALRPPPLVTIAYWQVAGAPPPLGLALLVRALDGPRQQIRLLPHEATASTPPDADLLVVPLEPEQELDEGARARLSAYLAEGGVILAEPANPLDEAATRAALNRLARTLERKGRAVEYGHPLLVAAHVFGTPPPGHAAGHLDEADGLLLSRAGYLAAWAGGSAEKPLPREAIRTAQEFGENLLAYAAARRGAGLAAR